MQHYKDGGLLLDKLVLKGVGSIEFDFGDGGPEWDRCLYTSVIEMNKIII